jgi:hypothetical protein
MYNSYFLLINGEFFASSGQVDISKESSVPNWKTLTKDLTVTSDTLDIILQILNFHHSKGGASKKIFIGENNFLQSINKRTQAYDLIMASSLFFIGLFFMVLYWFGKHEKQIFYFALFCLFYSYRAVGSESYTLHYLFPELPWYIAIRMEYISMYLSCIFFVYYSYHLYKAETSIIFVKICTGLCVTLILLSLITSPIFFTQITTSFSLFILFSFIYLFYTYIKATVYDRIGSRLSLISTLFLFVTISHTILAYLGMVNQVRTLYFIRFQQFFFFQSIILFYRYTLNLEMAKK